MPKNKKPAKKGSRRGQPKRPAPSKVVPILEELALRTKALGLTLFERNDDTKPDAE